MLTLHLAPIFKARSIERPFSFLVKSGFTTTAAHNILNNNTRSLKFDNIELLCKILVCEPSDLFVWIPAANEKFDDDYPLAKLRAEKEEKDMTRTLATMPFRQLKSLTKAILDSENQTIESK